MPSIVIPKGVQEARVGRSGQLVLLVIGGKTVEMPWQAALELGRALVSRARDAEEQAKAPQVARDAAILLRAGARIGLSSDPKIRDEAGKLAAWDEELRRCMPGGIKSQEMLGRPAITVHEKR